MEIIELKVTGKVSIEQHEDRIVVLFEKEKSEQVPKFKVGDWVRYKADGEPYEVLGVGNRGNSPIYLIEFSSIPLPINNRTWVAEWSLEPYAPKEGEYIFHKWEDGNYEASNIAIFRNINKKQVEFYALICIQQKNCVEDGLHLHPSIERRYEVELRPATPEEVKQLDDALAKEGKKWDAEKKQLVDLPKYKPAIIGEKAIAWDGEKKNAIIGVLAGKKDIWGGHLYRVAGDVYKNAILYESIQQYDQFRCEN